MARLPALKLFFPAAAVTALGVAAAKALQATGWDLPLARPLPADWHGHEMVLGYAYAVIGGFLLPRPDPGPVLAAFGAWLAGRAVLLFAALPGPAEAMIALAYPVLLFALAGVPLARAAKRPRNRIFAPLLGALAAAEGLYQLGALGRMPGGTAPGLLLAVDLVLLLLFVMGGRILATASSGAHQAMGWKPLHATHPRLERLGAALLVTAAAADLAGLPPPVAGLAVLLAAGVIARRLYRWRVWQILHDRGVACLSLGCTWLAAGLAAKGAAQLAGTAAPFSALHIALAGGLGTLSLTVMTRVALQRTQRGSDLPRPTLAAVALVSVAALARAAAWGAGEEKLWLGVAGGAWALAWVLFLAGLAGGGGGKVNAADKPISPAA